MIEQLFDNQALSLNQNSNKYFWDKLHQDDEEEFNAEVELKFQEKTNSEKTDLLSFFVDFD